MTDFMAKMHQIRFRLGAWGPAPDPAGGAYSAPRPPSCIWGLLLREGQGEEGRGGEGRGEERREESVPIVPVLRNDHCLRHQCTSVLSTIFVSQTPMMWSETVGLRSRPV